MANALRIGICGTGSFGTTRARALAQLPEARVGMGWSRSDPTRARFAAEFSVPTTATWEELCAHDDVDAVIVCTPNVEHHAQARAALEAGKHVLVETPMGIDLAQARDLAVLARQQGRVLHHGAKQRYHPDHDQHVQQWREIGNLLFGVDQNTFDFGAARGWYMQAGLTGGARTYLPYVMLNWMEAFGEVQRAVGARSERGTWDAAHVVLHFAGGGHALIGYALGLGIPEASSRQVVGDGCALLTQPDGTFARVRAEERTTLTQRSVDLVACECEAFLREVCGERDHQTPLEMDLRAWELVDEALG